jgi:N-acetylglucosaminyldiphosphoundecaprenol N-acetyl-beta-D-mannosaminyltransferase
MRQLGKKNVIGILIDAVDYEASVQFILRAARERRPAAVSALAVHGVMTGVLDPAHKFRLNHFDLLVPDGQPVRWVLNWLHRTELDDRVYGPNLTLKVCERAAFEGLPIYLYGSTAEILAALRKSLQERFPEIRIAGSEPSKFRRLTGEEKAEIAERIVGSGAAITLVGLGCPRQETFAYEFRDALSMPVLAVGAAFPFIAGQLAQAPAWMQDRGLEWLFRLCAEPKRLWRRYLYLNPAYLFLVALQASRLSRFATEGTLPVEEVLAG